MISAIILTKNEEKNIFECLKSISWCDEIIVIDDSSTDKTLKIVKEFKHSNLTLFEHLLEHDFSKQRNFGLDKAKGDWILFIDADERVSETLRDEIKNLISNSDRTEKLNGFYIRRVDFIWGKDLRYGETGNIKLLRLARKDSGRWEGKVHEEWKIKGNVGELTNPLIHYPHQSISEFLKDINFYTGLRAQELYRRGERANFLSILIYPKMKFIQNYFLKLGILDGMEGLIFAITMSFHSFLVRGKLWSLWDKSRK